MISYNSHESKPIQNHIHLSRTPLDQTFLQYISLSYVPTSE